MPTIFEELGIDIAAAKKNTSIKHYGVKGQKWGVRKDRQGKVLVTSKSSSITDKKPDVSPAIHKEARKLAISSIGAINSQAKFVGKNLNKPENKTLRKEYDKAVSRAVEDAYMYAPSNVALRNKEKLWTSVAVVASVGAFGVVALSNPKAMGALLDDVSRTVKHAATPEVTFDIGIKRNTEGFIIDLEDITEIQHHGIKGMRWGVRRSEKQLARARARDEAEDSDPTTNTQLSRVSKARTRYKSGPKLLTDAELKERISRMESEKRYNELNSRTIREGEVFIRSVLKDSAKAVATRTATALLMKGVQKSLSLKMGEEAVKEMFKKK